MYTFAPFSNFKIIYELRSVQNIIHYYSVSNNLIHLNIFYIETFSYCVQIKKENIQIESKNSIQES